MGKIKKFATTVVGWIKSIALIAASIICFCLAVWLAWSDKAAAGALAAGLFTVCVLLHYLPQIESFKAFGVEAKMRERLKEAEDILKQIKKMAFLSGKLAYHTVGWQSRMFSPVSVRQQLADEVDRLMTDVGIATEEHKAIKAEYLRLHIFDLHSRYVEVVKAIVDATENNLQKRMHTLGGKENEAQRERVRERQKQITDFKRLPEFKKWEEFDFDTDCKAKTPVSGLLDEADEKALSQFYVRVKGIVEACLADGRVTDAAIELLERRRARDVTGEVFGRDIGIVG